MLRLLQLGLLLVAARPGRSPGGCAASPPPRAAGRADRRSAGSCWTTPPLATSRARAAPAFGRAWTGGLGGRPGRDRQHGRDRRHGGQGDQRQAAFQDGSTVGLCSSVPRWPTGLADGLARRSRAWRVGPGWPLAFRPWGFGSPAPPAQARADSAQVWAAGYQPRGFCEQSLTDVMPAASGFSRRHGAFAASPSGLGLNLKQGVVVRLLLHLERRVLDPVAVSEHELDLAPGAIAVLATQRRRRGPRAPRSPP